MKRTRSASDEGDGPKQPIDAALARGMGAVLSRALRQHGREFAAGVAPPRAPPARGRRGSGDREAAAAAEPLIDALVARYRETGLVNDASYAAGRARRGVTQGRSLRRIAAGLAAKGVGAADTAAAIASLRDEADRPGPRRRHRLRPPPPPRPVPPRPAPARQPANVHRAELAAFARAGFTRRTAETVLACPDEAAVQALLAGDDADSEGSGIKEQTVGWAEQRECPSMRRGGKVDLLRLRPKSHKRN